MERNKNRSIGKKVDKKTAEFLSGQLQLLGKQEEEYLQALADEQSFQEKYRLLQRRLADFRLKCQEWREKVNDPKFIPLWQLKRDAVEFFGITAIVYKAGSDPRFEIQVTLPSIMSLIS